MARLLFASIGLDETRFWDERYNLENVRHTLESGSLRPLNGWYPAPSHLLHTALLAAGESLHRRLGWDGFDMLSETGFTPGAYLVCRSVQAIFGCLSLLLLYHLARRLGDWRLGLLAALLLAVAPSHLRLSVFFKPDILLLCAALWAVLASLRLLGQVRTIDFALAGTAVAFAASAKLPGVLAAVPVVVAAIAGLGQPRRRFLGLAAAGGWSALLFLLLNPSFRLYLEYFGRQQHQYAEQADATSHLGMLGAELRFLLDPVYHGPWLGSAALLGLVALVAGAVRRGRPDRRLLAVILSLPVAFSLVYALLTTHAKANNYLLIAPFTALGAAWLLYAAWSWVAKAGHRASRVARLAAGALVVGLVADASLDVYRQLVPSTRAELARRLRPLLEPIPLRVILLEGSERPFAVASFRERAVSLVAGDGESFAAERLRLADVEVFPMASLEGGSAAAVQARLDAAPTTLRVEPRLLRLRGPGLIAAVHPWTAAGAPLPISFEREAGTAGDFVAELPELPPGSVVSFEIWVPRADRDPLLLLGGQSVPLDSTRIDGRRDRLVSERISAPSADRLRLRLPPADDPRAPPSPSARGPQAALHLWQPGPGSSR